MMHKIKRLLIAAFLFLGTVGSGVWAEVDVPENTEHAWHAPNAIKSLLLSADGLDGAVWAVGERGHILKKSVNTMWQQASVPAQVLLTAVDMINDEYGWAVGHDAIILTTKDGGTSWHEIYKNIEEQRPLFDVVFSDRQNGIAIGAYGYYLYTHDGGHNWDEKLVNEEHDFHLNAISQSSNGALYIAAEAGYLYRSLDAGENWTTLESPYEGSYFDVLAWGGSDVLVAGLRGSLYHSSDQGTSWNKIPTSVQTSLNSIIRLRNGRLLVVGHAGVLLLLSEDLSQVEQYQLPDRKALADAFEIQPNQVLVFGEAGAAPINLCDVFTAETLPGCT